MYRRENPFQSGPIKIYHGRKHNQLLLTRRAYKDEHIKQRDRTSSLVELSRDSRNLRSNLTVGADKISLDDAHCTRRARLHWDIATKLHERTLSEKI